MKHEATGDQAARNAALFRPEGCLEVEGGRTQVVRPPLLFRLKRSIEVFPAPDGSVRLIHEGLGTHFKIDDLTAADLELLNLLQTDFRSQHELGRELQRAGHELDRLEVSLKELTKSGHLETRMAGEELPDRLAEKFDRQLIYFSDLCPPGGCGEELQERISAATVVILGCGGLGSWTAAALAGAGVGHLILVDDDQVELSNLNRQLLFKESDIGRPKVDAAADTLTAYNADLATTTLQKRVSSSAEIRDLMDGAEILVATADWPPYELPRWVNEASLESGVPYLSAGQFPPLVRIGPMVIPGETACHSCQEATARSEFPLYDQLAAFRASRPSTASTLGAASGVIGSLMAMEVIHHLTGEVEPATANQAMLMDLRTLKVELHKVDQNPNCECTAERKRQLLARGSSLA